MLLENVVTCTAPVNIAVLKYWGKRDESLILPMNSSVSVTLHQDQLRAKTTVAASKDFEHDCMWLNGKEVSMKNQRIQNVILEIKRRARKHKHNTDRETDRLNWNLHICSENNFPTAAGLASSAAGYACLVYALAKLYKIEGDISEIARQGSGSACRSVYGGFVVWNKGLNPDGSDSVARQLFTDLHWQDLHILIVVVSEKQKHTASTEGMQTTVNTSELLQHRVTTIPKKQEQITQAICNKDFKTFAEITMKDSNQLHAVCLDTFPPISYMNDVSHHIVTMVHRFNSLCQEVKVAYTFDAGPNACLFVQGKDLARFVSLLRHFFPPLKSEKDSFVSGIPVQDVQVMQEDIDDLKLPVLDGAVQCVIHTKPGPGPTLLEKKESLLTDMGLPKSRT